MPIYILECVRSKNKVELIQGMDEANPDCKECGGRMEKKITSPSIITFMRPGHIPERSRSYREGYSKEYLKDVGSVEETRGIKP